MKTALAFAALLALAACTGAEPMASTPPAEPTAALVSTSTAAMPPEPGRGPEATPDPAARAQCEASGGSYVRRGMRVAHMCVMPHADAGKACTDGDQCQGDCRLAEGERAGINSGSVTGQCQADSSPFGCFTQVEDGRADRTMCVD